MSDYGFSERELQLMESATLLKHLVEVQSEIIKCLTVRCGGAVKIDHNERHQCEKTYNLEKTIRVEDHTTDITLCARLK